MCLFPETVLLCNSGWFLTWGYIRVSCSVCWVADVHRTPGFPVRFPSHPAQLSRRKDGDVNWNIPGISHFSWNLWQSLVLNSLWNTSFATCFMAFLTQLPPYSTAQALGVSLLYPLGRFVSIMSVNILQLCTGSEGCSGSTGFSLPDGWVQMDGFLIRALVMTWLVIGW